MQVIRAWMQRTETIHWHEFDSNDAITRSYAMPRRIARYLEQWMLSSMDGKFGNPIGTQQREKKGEKQKRAPHTVRSSRVKRYLVSRL